MVKAGRGVVRRRDPKLGLPVHGGDDRGVDQRIGPALAIMAFGGRATDVRGRDTDREHCAVLTFFRRSYRRRGVALAWVALALSAAKMGLASSP